MKIYENITELTGRTPLIRLGGLEQKLGLSAVIFGKLEAENPTGSVKDRISLAMLKEAKELGILHRDSTIIEPTSGNTGIGLAAFAAWYGYRMILTMPDTMSTERRKLLAAYGAELVLTPGKEGMKGAIIKAKELADSIPHSFIPGQFSNNANPRAHYQTTGPEIWEDTDGLADILVAGVGTGGTISGTGRYLKEKNPKIKVVAVEPADSPVLSVGKSGAHKLQGIGPGFVPYTLDTELLDEVITVTTEEAYEKARLLARTDGVLTGISSGAALHAASVLAGRKENAGKRIVVILPDGGSRYLSSDLYRQEAEVTDHER